MAGVNTISPQSVKNLFGGGVASSGGTQVESADGRKGLDMNAFLTMFTTQLKHQDPTNPLESYELAAQLAQFSSVERLTNINSNLKEMQSYLASLNNSLMIGMIGREVVGLSDTLQLNSGQVSKGSYKLEVPAQVTVRIFDEKDGLVRALNSGTQNPGTYDVKWDGRNEGGQQMPDGAYHFKIEAVDSTGRVLDISPTVSGTVYSLKMEGGVPYLVLGGANGAKLSINEVMEIIGQGATG
jgi:flagellar basal-body rod modification protein FlgD